MLDSPLILILSLAILAVAALAGWVRLRVDPGKARGSTQKTGEIELTSDYQSGLGGHSTTWRIPADPQAYAKTFVPKGKASEE